MKIVIDIAEETYKYYDVLSAKGEVLGFAERTIMLGTPLPKHHGDLIDRDELLTWSHKMDTMYCIYDEVVDVGDVINAPTIIKRSESE